MYMYVCVYLYIYIYIHIQLVLVILTDGFRHFMTVADSNVRRLAFTCSLVDGSNEYLSVPARRQHFALF